LLTFLEADNNSGVSVTSSGGTAWSPNLRRTKSPWKKLNVVMGVMVL